MHNSTIIKKHHSKLYRTIRKVARRINTITKQIENNKDTIKLLEMQIKKNNLSEKKIQSKRNRIKNLINTNKRIKKRKK